MVSDMEEVENMVNAAINAMRRIMHAATSDPAMMVARPKIKEMAHRLDVQHEAFREHVARMNIKEPAPGQPEPGSPSAARAPAQTPPDVLSSPYAGEEPRHVMQSRGEPDPIARARQTPPSEAAGAKSDDDARTAAHNAGAKPAARGDDKNAKR